MDENLKGTRLTHLEAMKLAVQIAKKGSWRVSPNPHVGCVILDSQNYFLTSGYHEYFGGAHAEASALKNLQSKGDLQGLLKNAKLFVTLEPCAHEGKTPSCAKTLAQYPLAEVHYGLIDPNPLVAGKGIKILNEAGINCFEFPELRNELEASCEIFLWNHQKKSAFISLKLATSLDGQIALKTGESKWISGEKSRQRVQELRAIHDGILIGKGTLLTDNPSLHHRLNDVNKQNKIFILDPQAELFNRFDSFQIAQKHSSENVYWIIDSALLPEIQSNKLNRTNRTPKLLGFPSLDKGLLNLSNLGSDLLKLGITSLLVEGGAEVSSSFLTQSIVQKLYLFLAPSIIGSANGKSWTQSFGIEKLSERIQLGPLTTECLDMDLLITTRF